MLRITLYLLIFITYVLFDTRFECFDVCTKYYFGNQGIEPRTVFLVTSLSEVAKLRCVVFLFHPLLNLSEVAKLRYSRT